MKNDGGPAFPSEVTDGCTSTPDGMYIQERYKKIPGMTLRDYFAGQVVVGLLSSGIAAERRQSSEEVALIAYKNADAMIAERNKQTKEEGK